jgi:hypothetical protein
MYYVAEELFNAKHGFAEVYHTFDIFIRSKKKTGKNSCHFAISVRYPKDASNCNPITFYTIRSTSLSSIKLSVDEEDTA